MAVSRHVSEPEPREAPIERAQRAHTLVAVPVMVGEVIGIIAVGVRRYLRFVFTCLPPGVEEQYDGYCPEDGNRATSCRRGNNDNVWVRLLGQSVVWYTRHWKL